MTGCITMEQINPYIRVAMQSILPAGTEIKRRIIFDYELIYIEKGTFLFGYSDQEYSCHEGQFLLIRPGIAHKFHGINQDLSQPHIHFDMVYDQSSEKIPVSFKDLCDFTIEEKKMIRKDIFDKFPLSPFISFPDTAGILKLFYQIVTNTSSNSKLLLKTRLLEIIDIMISSNFPEFFANDAKNEWTISRQIKEYFDAGQGMSVQLSDLEKQFSYSKYYLDRQFKKEYGVSLMVYRNEKRMQRARALLKEKTVSHTAMELGFSSIYAFSRAYKNYFGHPPST